MDFPATEMRDRRRLSLNVMLNCRTLLPDVKGEDEMINCFDYVIGQGDLQIDYPRFTKAQNSCG